MDQGSFFSMSYSELSAVNAIHRGGACSASRNEILILILVCNTLHRLITLCVNAYGNSSTWKSKWDEENLFSRKNKHAKCAIDPQTAVCILRRSSDKHIWNPVPLYLVTTAALTLRGSWKLTVSDELLVTMRQALAGTSGAPGTEGETQGP